MTKPLASMTGYARAGGAAAGASFSCEIKSVNGRGLDIRMRLSSGLDGLEAELRRRIGEAFSRGSVTISLNLERHESGGEVVVNQAALDTIIGAMSALSRRIDADKPRLDGILALKGVLEQRDTPLDENAEEALRAAVLDCTDKAIADLVIARHAEGERLRKVLDTRIEEIAALTRDAEAHPSRSRDVIQTRLRQQVADLIEASVGLAEDRLAQEALLLATKADIREELDRLHAHVATARQLVRNGGPVGRKLDFLAQEFNREANTLCSKSNAVDLTAIGLDLKAAIDQLREQVQNIE